MSIQNRILKLLALAEDCRGNEEEAKAAMAKVHQLLSEHNLSMAEVKEGSLEDDRPIAERVQDNVVFIAGGSVWKRWVYDAVARLYYGFTYYSSGGYERVNGSYCKGTKVTIIASEYNAAVAKQVAEFVIDQIETLAKLEASGCGRSFIDSYKKGCAARINQRCKELIAQAKANTIPNEAGTALMCLSDLYNRADEAIKKHLKDQGVRLSAGTSASAASSAGYAAGRSAGDRVSLNNPLGSKSTAYLR